MNRAWLLHPASSGEGASTSPYWVQAVDSPAPAPGPGEVMLAIEAAALGPVDLAVAAARGAATDDALAAGLSAVGRVVAAGDDESPILGARAILGPHVPCGECDVCRRGGAVVCPLGVRLGVTTRGALAERVTLPVRWLVAFGGDLDIPGPAAALLGGDAALAYAMYARAGVGPGEPTIVVGDGVVARFLVEILAAKQAPPVVLARTGAPEGWVAWAGERGRVTTVTDHAPAPEWRAAAVAAMRAAGHGERPWRLFETTGEAERQTRALAIAGPRATVVLAAPSATGHPPHPVDLGDTLDRDAVVIGVAGAHPDLLVDVAAMAVRGELDLDAACDAVPVDELGPAFARRAGVPLATALVATI